MVEARRKKRRVNSIYMAWGSLFITFIFVIIIIFSLSSQMICFINPLKNVKVLYTKFCKSSTRFLFS